MKMLVTGASGFVGERMCSMLNERGLGCVPVYRTPRHGGVAVGDINGSTDWGEALQGGGCVIHLAGRAHIMDEKATDPLAAYRVVNTEGTLNLARQAAAAGVQRFVFVSSIKVNGESTTGRPFSGDDAVAPDDPYGISKHEAEQGLWRISVETGMEVVVVRPPLIYGAGVKANFEKLMTLVEKGVPLPLGSVDNRRSLVYIDNLCDLLIRCASHPNAPGKTFMVSDGHDLSTAGLLRELAKAMGCKSRLFPFPVGLIGFATALLGKRGIFIRLCGSLQVDVQTTKQVLDWEPPVAVGEAMAATANWFLGKHL